MYPSNMLCALRLRAMHLFMSHLTVVCHIPCAHQGNYNNVLEVHQRPPSITSKEKLQLARWQAANVALETKMMTKLRS